MRLVNGKVLTPQRENLLSSYLIRRMWGWVKMNPQDVPKYEQWVYGFEPFICGKSKSAHPPVVHRPSHAHENAAYLDCESCEALDATGRRG